MPAAPPIIQLDQLEKTYDSGGTQVLAVRNLTLEIHAGEFVAIMGSSGSGKSTLMNIIGCLDRPTAGTYHLDGLDVSSQNRNQLADVRNQKIGFVFQGSDILTYPPRSPRIRGQGRGNTMTSNWCLRKISAF